MKKYQFVLIIFVFWWSLFCPSFGRPSKAYSDAQEDAVSTQKEMQEPAPHFRFKYLTFFNSLFSD